jgi:hypothetical protein
VISIAPEFSRLETALNIIALPDSSQSSRSLSPRPFASELTRDPSTPFPRAFAGGVSSMLL